MSEKMNTSGPLSINSVRITRVINSCALIQFGEDAVLTDPYFNNQWYFQWNEDIGMAVSQLPRLSAILGGHSVPDHWQINALKSYPFKAETPVFVATKSMAQKALKTGFKRVEVLDWNEFRHLTDDLSLEVVEAQHSGGLKVNNYVLATPDLRVFIGSEARDLEPLRQFRSRLNSRAMDVVMAPVNGARLFGLIKLVMTGKDAVEATQILGARTLIAMHDEQVPFPPLFTVTSSVAEAEKTARHNNIDIDIVRLKPGVEWTYKHS